MKNDLVFGKAKVHGVYKINPSLTPKENVTAIMKKIDPIALSLNILASNGKPQPKSVVVINGIQIYAADKYKNAIDFTSEFKRIVIYMNLPDVYGRSSYRKWSLLVSNNNTVSLSWVSKIFDTLYGLVKNHNDKKAAHEAEVKAEEERIKELKESSCLTSRNVSLYHRAYASEYSITIDKLTEDQVRQFGPLMKQMGII